MSRIRLVLVPLVVAGLSFGVAACGDDDDDSGDTGGGGETSLDMTIGVSLPLSGDLADASESALDGGGGYNEPDETDLDA